MVADGFPEINNPVQPAPLVDSAVRHSPLVEAEHHDRLVRHVAPSYRVLRALPDYLRHGEPTHPDQLAGYQCIVYSARNARHWLFQGNDAHVATEIHGTSGCNDGDAASVLAMAGAGIFASRSGRSVPI